MSQSRFFEAKVRIQLSEDEEGTKTLLQDAGFDLDNYDDDTLVGEHLLEQFQKNPGDFIADWDPDFDFDVTKE